jgi:hypothetical protein
MLIWEVGGDRLGVKEARKQNKNWKSESASENKKGFKSRKQ